MGSEAEAREAGAAAIVLTFHRICFGVQFL